MLKVDGKEVANQKMGRMLPLILQWDENFDIGADTGTPVDDKDYQVPFKFTGNLDKLTLTPRLELDAHSKQLKRGVTASEVTCDR